MQDPRSEASGAHEVATETWNRRQVRVVARRMIVKLAPVESVSALDAACYSVVGAVEGAHMVRKPGNSGRMVITVPEGVRMSTIATQLAKRADVLYVEPDVIDSAQIVPNDPRYATQWAPAKVNAEAAWDLTTGASNVLIGVIDSGISMSPGGALDHEDLSTPGRFTLGTDFVDGGTPRDLNGHGTHVAGIAAAVGNSASGIAGMNWGSRVYICRTLDANGNGSSADFADAVEEITDFAVANSMKAAINYSGGGADNQTKRDACQYASDRGVLVIAATGNDNGGAVIFPAAYSTTIDGVIGVGSTTQTDTVSPFSNVGPEVTVVAPGSSIVSTLPTYAVGAPPLPLNYGTLSGTSMATPLVTGLAALMWSRHPGFAHTKIKQCLKDSAVKLGSGSFNNNWGFGRVDALAALTCGDPSVPPSLLKGLCDPVPISRLTACKSVITVCLPASALCPPRSRLAGCPSRLPVLCPTTRLTICEPVPSRLIAGCLPPSKVCASAIDACPSALGCPDGRPPIDLPPIELPPVFGPILQQINERLRALESEARGSAEAPSTDSGTGGQDWFYVDDDGQVQGWP